MDADFDRKAWATELEQGRDEARDYFMNVFSWRGTQMPEGFEGPRYFPLSEEWRVRARLDRKAPGAGQHVHLLTSTGDEREFQVYGRLVFEHDGRELHLTAYQMVPEPPGFDELFVPFKDETTGKQSYGAGRYLDVPRLDVDDYVLDFNRAYNPTCAYSPRYNCPYPPPENTLPVAVEAGEMVPFEH